MLLRRDKLAIIEEIGAAATKAQKRYGVPASVIIAQAIIESDFGRNFSSASTNKWFARGARKFRSVSSCVNAQARMISSRRPFEVAMSALEGRETNPLMFLVRLQELGYSSDPKYPLAVLQTIQDWNLARFDTSQIKEKK